jgi:hypothetical protein
MQTEERRISISAALGLVLAAGALYCATHLMNGWAFQTFELSDHVNLVYLPSFLRLMNVLVLGMLWGTLGTAAGGAMLFFWLQDNLLLATFNTAVSASCAALSLWLLQILQHRRLSITRLSDLIKLALLNALLNALLHHLVWTWLDPNQLVTPHQVVFMVIGDINGALLGALALRWLATRTSLIEHAQQKVADQSPK